MAIAIFLMIILSTYVFDRYGWHDDIKREYYAEQAKKQAALEAQKFDPVAEDYFTKNPPTMVYPDNGEMYFESVPTEDVPDEVIEEFLEPEVFVKEPVTNVPVVKRGGKIAIVIDDIGMNRKWSKASIDLPVGVTLAILPYAKHARVDAVAAKEKGHELIIHTPMEAMTPDLDYGGMGLLTSMSLKELSQAFDKITQSFDGYKGVNNHMGSKLTQDTVAMRQLMSILKTRQLYFLDSKTIHTSVAGQVASEMDVPFAIRDVFLDHEDTPEYVAHALSEAERIASEHGSAIAIGHPKKNTIEALQKWLPTLKDKGFEIVPLSELVVQP